ncbi:thioesterase superfamily protein [Rhodopseudomonas thermotolerans]|uniref:Thioesterase superfamily protein n=2 Tax=Rhodopseudomonas TaxID=1073 RepID=A0A336JLG6_9BRAD|nr:MULTISPECIES: hotdog domain-containing protein [Rhodopseudomonas]RED37558.1 thioesterase superfamily protein [Rhodopseudomonas pentothenatexigens]REG04044.1 thioesterase superfamily protein [Rhodopseudomonas thermotolerans]SSW90525.1 thioesterase superfamily protein [Rhodopseudomonas pentothenatexigens]
MDARDFITVGMSAERLTTVTQDITVQHFVPYMPAVFATPLMILEMEMASGEAVYPVLPAGWISVGSEVDIRHLAPAFVGQTVRTTATVSAVERRLVRFEVASFVGPRKIGDGRHARGLVEVALFTRRFAEG